MLCCTFCGRPATNAVRGALQLQCEGEKCGKTSLIGAWRVMGKLKDVGSPPGKHLRRELERRRRLLMGRDTLLDRVMEAIGLWRVRV
jgi:hypothetical protein